MRCHIAWKMSDCYQSQDSLIFCFVQHFLTCQGMYICQQKFKTNSRAYINLHFAILFVHEMCDMVTCTPRPGHTLPGRHYDQKWTAGCPTPLPSRKLVLLVHTHLWLRHNNNMLFQADRRPVEAVGTCWDCWLHAVDMTGG